MMGWMAETGRSGKEDEAKAWVPAPNYRCHTLTLRTQEAWLSVREDLGVLLIFIPASCLKWLGWTKVGPGGAGAQKDRHQDQGTN